MKYACCKCIRQMAALVEAIAKRFVYVDLMDVSYAKM